MLKLSALSYPAKTMAAFGTYALLAGVGLFLAPVPLLAPLAIVPVEPVWVRMLGCIAMVVGIYYLQAARHELVPMFRITIVGRCWFFTGTVLLVLLADAPPALIGFGVVDLAGAAWTAWAMRSSA